MTISLTPTAHATFADPDLLRDRLAAADSSEAVTAILCAWRGQDDPLIAALMKHAPVLDDAHVRLLLTHRVDGEAFAAAPGLSPAQRGWVRDWAVAIVGDAQVAPNYRRFARELASALAGHVGHDEPTGAYGLTAAQAALLEVATSGKSAARRTEKQRTAMTSLLASAPSLAPELLAVLAGHFLNDEGAVLLLQRPDLPNAAARALVLPQEAWREDSVANPQQWRLTWRLRDWMRSDSPGRDVHLADPVIASALMKIAEWVPDEPTVLVPIVLSAPIDIAVVAWEMLLVASPRAAHETFEQDVVRAGRCLDLRHLTAWLEHGGITMPDYIPSARFGFNASTARQAAICAVGVEAADGERRWRPDANDEGVLVRVEASVEADHNTARDSRFGRTTGGIAHMEWELFTSGFRATRSLEGTLQYIVDVRDGRHPMRHALHSRDWSDAVVRACERARLEFAAAMLAVWQERVPAIATGYHECQAAHQALERQVFGRSRARTATPSR